jgi:hypothetical protein
MRNRIAHHGQISPIAAQSYSHVESQTRKVIAISPDGRIEEWMSSIRRHIEMIVIGTTLLIRQRIHIRITVRRMMEQALDKPLTGETRRPVRVRPMPTSEETREGMLTHAFAELDRTPETLPALAA